MALAIPPHNKETELGVSCPFTLSEKQVQEIIRLSDSLPMQKGGIQRDDQIEMDRSYRDVNLYIIPEQIRWIDDLLIEIAFHANKEFQFSLCGLIERPQLLRYHAGSQGYGWHMDLGSGDHSVRKIAISCLLNDDYHGGELCFFMNGEAKFKPSAGQCISFPAFFPHRVAPITKGIRWSLVAWIAGDPFR